MDQQENNIIVLDDVSSLRQRVIGTVILLAMIVALAVPFAQGFTTEEVPAAPREQVSDQRSVFDMCSPWSVPDSLQPVANIAYPGWNWICRLVQQ
ncbi:MAG: hypothetical protein WKF81_04595 [Thermomicrobiales bacterium]